MVMSVEDQKYSKLYPAHPNLAEYNGVGKPGFICPQVAYALAESSIAYS